MAREPVWIAVWRMNRVFPTVVAGLLGVNLIAFAVAGFLVTPRLERLEKDFVGLQQEYRKVRRGEETPNSRRRIFQQGREDLQTFRAALPPERDFTALLDDLFSMAGTAGLDIDRIDYDPEAVEGEGLLSYSLNFNVRGDYGQVKKFIFLIEHSPRLVAIEKLSLNKARETAAGQVALQLRLTTYFRMDER